MKKVLSGILALLLGVSLTLSVSAAADDILLPEVTASNVFTAPAIITEVNTAEELAALDAARPNTAIFTVNDRGEVLLDGSVVGTASETAARCENILPAFAVSSETAVDAVLADLDAAGIHDFFLISESSALLDRAIEQTIWARTVLRVTDAYRDADGNYDLMKIRGDANSVGCHVVLLPVEISNRSTADYLQRRLIGVWTSAPDANYGTMAAILSGGNGIVTRDVTGAKAALAENFEKNTMTRQVLIIGHRGLPGSYPENTIEGSLLAVEAGADIVENDIYLTRDNVLVIMHDSDISRTTNGTGNIEDFTLDQLKVFRVDTHAACTDWRIPTLEEYFIEWKKMDTDKQLFVEIKSGKPEAIDEFVRLVKEYDIADQVSVISFSQDQLNRLHDAMPEMSIGYLTSGMLTEDVRQSLKSVIRIVQKMETTFNHDSGGITKTYFDQLNLHGITHWPWTYRDQSEFIKHFLIGLNGLTTDYANWIGETVKYCCVGEGLADTELTLIEGETLTDVFRTMKYNGVSAPGGDIRIVAGGEHLSADGNTLTALSPGEAYLYAVAQTAVITKPIRATSDLIKVTIMPASAESVSTAETPEAAETSETPEATEATATAETAEAAPASTSSAAAIAAAGAVLLVLAAGTIVAVQRKK
ncbi:MAG: glycerophosphodiester phosphodiesterase [Eubacteriales bacterium]